MSCITFSLVCPYLLKKVISSQLQNYCCYILYACCWGPGSRVVFGLSCRGRTGDGDFAAAKDGVPVNQGGRPSVFSLVSMSPCCSGERMKPVFHLGSALELFMRPRILECFPAVQEDCQLDLLNKVINKLVFGLFIIAFCLLSGPAKTQILTYVTY